MPDSTFWMVLRFLATILGAKPTPERPSPDDLVVLTATRPKAARGASERAPADVHTVTRVGRETTPPQPEWDAPLRELAEVAVRRSVELYRAGARPSFDNLRQFLRPVCDSARETGLRAEQLLVILKRSWDHVPETEALDRDDADAALSELITLCIKEFYRTAQTN